MLKMRNPWEKLVRSDEDLYVLDEDYDQLMTHNKSKSLSSRDAFVLDLIPEPFTGDINAPIVILNTNPGYSKADYVTLHNNYFHRYALLNLQHYVDLAYPFFMLSLDIYNTPTYAWWRKMISPLIDDSAVETSIQTIAKNIFCIRYVAYHSSSFNVSRHFSLPSQLYTKYLIERAMEQNKLILCQRSHQRFQRLCPTLIKYNNIYYAQNPQAPQINRYNFSGGFDLINVSRSYKRASHNHHHRKSNKNKDWRNNLYCIDY